MSDPIHDPTPPTDPTEAITRLRQQLADALADSETKESTITALRAQIVEMNEPPADPLPAPALRRRGFYLEEVTLEEVE